VTLRGVDLAAVLGGSALGATILAGCVAFATDGPPLGYVRLALVALAAGAAYVFDEPAAAAVDAVPCTRRRRTAARATAVVAPYSVWAGGISALELRNAVTPVDSLLVEGAGVLARVAVELVLDVDPDHVLASRIASALSMGVPPREAAAIVRAGAEEARERIGQMP